LRANTIQAIGEILESVSSQPEVCNADAREVLQLLTEMMGSGKMDESDPQISTIQRCLSQLAKCLKHDFEPYLGPIMQQLLKDARAKIEVKIVDADAAAAEEDEGDGKFTSAKIEMKGVEGSKVISMNTSLLQNKL
jgi:hypothetical protein